MSLLMRCGSVALLVGLLAADMAAYADDKPGWTDPPVRGAAVSQNADPGKAEERSAPTPAKEGAALPSAQKEAARETGADDQRPFRVRSARLRRDHIRQAAAGSRSRQEQSVAMRRVVARSIGADGFRPADRQARSLSSRHAQTAMSARQMRQRNNVAQRYARRNFRSFDDNDAGASSRYGSDDRGYAPYRVVRGWDPYAEDRANRIAAARAAGYPVMRSRSYGDYDGSRYQSIRPFFIEDPSGLD